MLKKIFPVLFLFAGFQANAAVIGNLSYDGTFITGDGYTYLALDTMAGSSYADYEAATSAGGAYADFAIADIAVADQFVDSLLAGSNPCSLSGTELQHITCGNAAGWSDGVFGDTSFTYRDTFFFFAAGTELGWVDIRSSDGRVRQIEDSPAETTDGPYPGFSLLLFKTLPVPEPSIIALFGLGLLGLGFTRRRKVQS